MTITQTQFNTLLMPELRTGITEIFMGRIFDPLSGSLVPPRDIIFEETPRIDDTVGRVIHVWIAWEMALIEDADRELSSWLT